MEILKHGRVTGYVAECPQCGCEFKFSMRELSHEWSGEGGDFGFHAYVHCPECGIDVMDTRFKEVDDGQ